MSSKWSRVELSLATEEDKATLAKRAFDYTKLSAVNMCPTWGITRYSLHKTMPGGGRAMALEAGTVMHECFAAIRLASLGYQADGRMRDHAEYHGAKLFGAARWDALRVSWASGSLEDTLRAIALECLATSGYVDDPFDKRRTYVNLETSLLYYVQRWDAARYPVWVRDANDPTSDIGVEIPFAVKVQPYGNEHNDAYPLYPFLYTGRVDGIHTNGADSTELLIQENKTASRLDDAWRMSFEMSHQVTGYAVAGSLFAGSNIERGLVLGLSLPLPRYASEGLAIEGVRRPDYMKARWLAWLEYTVGVHDQYVNTPLSAPKHTHSCNRYFRPCSMIPLCSSDEEEQRIMLEQMVTEEWSPLHEKSGD